MAGKMGNPHPHQIKCYSIIRVVFIVASVCVRSSSIHIFRYGTILFYIFLCYSSDTEQYTI